jgi:hypothetical protein
LLLGAVAGPATEPTCPRPDQSCGRASPLDQLALTIGALKTSLSAIRQDLEAAAGDAPQAPVDRLCAVPLAAAQAARDRATVANHIVGHGETLEPNAKDLAAGAAGGWQSPPILSAEAAEVESVPQPPLLRRPTDSPPPAQAVAADKSAPAANDRLQLQAELALAQLKIAELSTALESARRRQEAMAAEVSALGALTDAQIKQLLGWH